MQAYPGWQISGTIWYTEFVLSAQQLSLSQQNPPQSVSGIIPIDGWDRYHISNSEVLDALRRNGYIYRGSHPWYLVNLLLEHGEQITMRDGSVLIAWAGNLKTREEDLARDKQKGWESTPNKYTVQEAADALMRMSVVSPREAAERLGIQPEPSGQSNRALLTLMKTIESEISPESIDGIELCGYEEI